MITTVLFVGVATIANSTVASEITTRANPFFSEVFAQTTPSPSSDAPNSNKSLEQLQSQISSLQKQYDIMNKQLSNLQGNISKIQSDKVSRSNLEGAIAMGLSQHFPEEFSNYAQSLAQNNPNGWIDFNIAPNSELDAVNSELDAVWNCLIDAANYAIERGNQFSEFHLRLANGCQQEP
jgi:hypothetical protein